MLDFSEARAGVIVSTLGLSNDGPFPGEQVGAAIQIGSTPISLSSVVYTERFSSGPTPGETFAVFSRNADGTVGGSLFSDFSLSYDSGSFNTTATATAPFSLQANTSYWLMMIEIPGTFGDWDNSLAYTYTSTFDVSIPTTNTSVSYFSGAYAYANLTDGLQLFQFSGEAIPEPSTLALATTSAVIMLGATWLCQRRGGKLVRSARG
jgi:hypothetical protein